MAQLNLHKNFPLTPPPRQVLSIIEKLKQTYKFWQEFLLHFPKTSRYTLGSKIDSLFLEILESIFKAFQSNKGEKIVYLAQASAKLDLLKLFLQIAWEIKALDDKKYILLSEKLDEIGKMLGGWVKAVK